IERLGQVQRALEVLKTLAPASEPLAADVRAAASALEDAAHRLQALAERWESDPEALEANLARQDLLDRLKKKYGGDLSSVIAHAGKLRDDLGRLENVETYRRQLDERCAEASRALDKACRSLSAKRQRAAKDLAQAVQKELGALGLREARFQCSVQTQEPTTTGIDRAVFEWAPNPGEGIRPLKDIASGGEMSRVMLALKTVLARADEVPTLVFDEIDAGIGGMTAQAIGRQLRALSRHYQILCVSHLPQIAACAHAHFQVSKHVSKARTSAHVVRLEQAERLHELARLLGSQVTPTSVQHAKELLAQNQ
ncbi:MAG TPA: DNA repair protein RecN, partial [Elusimicrobiota bacterium]|nr:DNA repair protein RecN [Elusimicrobiota bacterium]